MNLRDFRKVGHFPTLFCAFLYFDVSFMIWVLMGPLAMRIVGDFFPQQSVFGVPGWLLGRGTAINEASCYSF